ncbi:hypothetical protein SAMN05421663_102231 [Terribacillus halophilus]|uniref:Uncharacterized protein n=1 Tax=Terribacillus halophilus TaxID=361279 RepID=A0A1G6L3W7_9BACI|nr:hypothetical protein [Terribacillus halophilus]SDC37435.1 hypothetical protein SAMN05421663_102231 [Terribacillus halophilus]
MEEIANYFNNNTADLIKDTIFMFLGALLGLFITPRNNSNQQEEVNIKKYNKYVINEYITIQRTKFQQKEGNDGYFPWMIILGLTLLTYLFIKYNAQILNYFNAMFFFCLASVATIIIRLIFSGLYNKLNILWTVISLIILSCDIFTLHFLKQQALHKYSSYSLSTLFQELGIDGFIPILYTFLGFILIIFLNVLLLLLLIHLYCFNFYITKGVVFSNIIIKKTSMFLYQPIQFSLFILFTCVLTILFSSGTFYELVQRYFI